MPSSSSNAAYLQAYEANIPPLYTIRESRAHSEPTPLIRVHSSRIIDMGTSWLLWALSFTGGNKAVFLTKANQVDTLEDEVGVQLLPNVT